MMCDRPVLTGLDDNRLFSFRLDVSRLPCLLVFVSTRCQLPCLHYLACKVSGPLNYAARLDEHRDICAIVWPCCCSRLSPVVAGAGFGMRSVQLDCRSSFAHTHIPRSELLFQTNDQATPDEALNSAQCTQPPIPPIPPPTSAAQASLMTSQQLQPLSVSVPCSHRVRHSLVASGQFCMHTPLGVER